MDRYFQPQVAVPLPPPAYTPIPQPTTYCAEEIMAVAKKCKHCGSWLDESSKPSNTKQEINDVRTVNPKAKNGIKTSYVILAIVAVLVIAGGIYWLSASSPNNESPINAAESSIKDPYDASNDTYDKWLGTLKIEGSMYRTCETRCYLELEKNGDWYKGDIRMFLGDYTDIPKFDAFDGCLYGKIRAKSTGDHLLVTMISHSTERGRYGNLFENHFNGEEQIFMISCDGSNYSTRAIGKMEHFFDGGEIYTTK